MKKILAFLAILFWFGIYSKFFSQITNFDWVKTWGYMQYGQINAVFAQDMVIDDFGNSYVLSTGNTQVNFNPNGSPSITAPSQGCGAISKFDVSGNLIWVKFIVKTGGTFGGCTPEKITLKGNYIYYSGKISTNGLVDFDLGSGVNNLSGSTCFVSKIDLDGNLQWVQSFGIATTTINDITIDNSNNVVVTGKYESTIFHGSQSITSNGGNDIFVAKWNGNGVEQWIKGFGGNTTFIDSGNGIVTSSNNDIYVIGNFEGTVDFDPNAGINNLTSNGAYDFFVQKLNSVGDLIWVYSIGGASSDFGNDITIDSNNDIIFTGMNSGTVDFNSGTGINNLTPTTSNAFVSKWDENANFIWAKSIISSSNPRGLFLVSDIQNNYYITGITQGTADFDPSSSIFNLTTNGQNNTFILILSEMGLFQWAGILDGQSASNNGNEPSSIKSSTNSIYISGSFKGQVDFDPNTLQNQNVNSSVNSSGVPDYSAFILKLAYCPTNGSSTSITQCQSYTWPENNTTYTNSGVYTQTLTNINGCDSIVTLNLTILPSQTNTVNITQCDNYISPLGNNYNTSGTYNETYSNINGCDSIVTINLTITNLQNTVSVSSCGIYTSPLGNSYSSSGTYQEIYSTQTGCDSTVNILLTINNDVSINQTITTCSSFISPTGNNYTESGQYFDTLTTNLGCDSIIVTQLTILNPTSNIISPIVCNSYTSPSGNVYNQTGTYIDTIQNNNGCDSIITINLQVVGTLNVDAGPDINVCAEESIVLSANGAINYSWNNGIQNGVAFSPLSTSYFIVTGTDGNGCSGKDSVLVTVNNPPTISFNYILPDCEGGITGSINTQVNGSNPISYQWSTGSTIQNLQDVSAGTYNLIVIDGIGCSENQNFNLPDGEGDCLIIPTGFTPNGDNQNDTWQIVGIENFTKNNVQVFNRWGQTVFESQGTIVNWDGKYKDEILPIADYYFVVDLGNGQVFNGTVTLKY